MQKNFYDRKSPRLKDFDYSSHGSYFITIITKNREHLFGEILNSAMYLNDFGKIVQEEWLRSFVIRKELFCDEYIIMPNHIHAILFLVGKQSVRFKIGISSENISHSSETETKCSTEEKEFLLNNQDALINPNKSNENDIPFVEDVCHASLRRSPKSISSFIAGFKSAVTKRFNELQKKSGISIWQSRYHDHIIRNEKEFLSIKMYIQKNPQNWEYDSEY